MSSNPSIHAHPQAIKKREMKIINDPGWPINKNAIAQNFRSKQQLLKGIASIVHRIIASLILLHPRYA